MRVIIEIAGVGVQYANGPGFALKLFIVEREGMERLPTALHHQIVNDALMLPGQRPEFFGQGEGDEEILGRHLFLQLAFDPLLTFVILAMRAVAVAAGMRYENLAVAVFTLRRHQRALGGAAVLHRAQGRKLTW